MTIKLITEYELDDAFVEESVREYADQNIGNPHDMTLDEWKEFIEENALFSTVFVNEDLTKFIEFFKEVCANEGKRNTCIRNIQKLVKEAVETKTFSSVQECLEAIAEVV